MRRRVRVQVSPRAVVVLPRGDPLRVSLLGRVVRRRESRRPRAVTPAIHVMTAVRRPDPLTRVPLDQQVVQIPVIVALVRVVRIPVTAAQVPVGPIRELPGRQIAEMIVGTTGVLMIGGRLADSVMVHRVAQRPQIAGVLPVRDRVLALHVVPMIDMTVKSARNAPSVFANLIFLMRSRQNNSTS